MKVEEIKLAFESNQKFELALIDDLKKAESNLKKLEQTHLKEIEDYRTLINRMKASIKANTNLSTEFLTKIQDAEKMAKDLGLDANQFSSYRNSLNSYYDTIAIADKILA